MGVFFKIIKVVTITEGSHANKDRATGSQEPISGESHSLCERATLSLQRHEHPLVPKDRLSALHQEFHSEMIS